MSEQSEFLFSDRASDTDLLLALFEKADRLFVKKLSNNDRDWARFDNKHQAGVYVPREHRDGGFFPALKVKKRSDPGASEIRERFFEIVWPQSSDEPKKARLVHYTSKNQETHLTGLPRALFSDLLPASFLVMGRIRNDPEPLYECLTIDSGSDDAAYLTELIALEPDFTIGEFDPAGTVEEERERILDFAEQVIEAWLAGDIIPFAAHNAAMPNTTDLAGMARSQFLERHELATLNPFEICNPGDALREISRSIEWDLFREFQRRERAVALVRIVMGDDPVTTVGAAHVIRRLVDELPEIDRLMLSASQQRKSRAGYSYEHHIEAMLVGGGIPFEKQVMIEARKRPDFILPSLEFINAKKPEAETGLILSAKTTLRERWKQVEREKGKRALFLTTVDENIASNVIEDMASFGVHLVIPESLKDAKETEYKGHTNVLSFREFCDDVVQPSMGKWA
ncbi:restriction endonuclease [Guyparkeria halophila]|uniref:Restriction endonuclease n=1 Tax=Guyparkeria halophila TaxID=47960 RepID=A0A6I6DC57_9GAMM|nr:type II restriction endonuclease [Guyparkeria halophila]QGT79372.1 restriction endonuclease [Guyparkeria halophila]